MPPHPAGVPLPCSVCSQARTAAAATSDSPVRWVAELTGSAITHVVGAARSSYGWLRSKVEMGQACSGDDSDAKSKKSARKRKTYDAANPDVHAEAAPEPVGAHGPALFEAGVGANALTATQWEGTECSHLFVGSEEGEIVELRVSGTPKLTTTVHRRWSPHNKDINKLVIEANTGVLYSASRDKMVVGTKVRSDADKLTQQKFSGHSLNVTCVTASPKGSFIVTGSRDNTVRLWDASNGREIAMNDTKLNIVHCCCWVPMTGAQEAEDGSGVVAQGGEDLTVRLWDIRARDSNPTTSLSLKHTLANFDYHPICCTLISPNLDGTAASPTGMTLFTGHNGFNGHGCMLTEWDLRMLRALRSFNGHENTVRWIQPLARKGGDIDLLSASDDGTLRRWEYKPLTELPPPVPAGQPLPGATEAAKDDFTAGRMTCLAALPKVSPAQRLCAVSTRSGVVSIVDVPEDAAKPIKSLLQLGHVTN